MGRDNRGESQHCGKVHDILTETGVIYQKRGIGFFVCEDAKEKILASERRRFIEEELPAIIKRASLLGLDLKQLI